MSFDFEFSFVANFQENPKFNNLWKTRDSQKKIKPVL